MQRHMLQSNCCLPKFLDRSNPLFRPIHGACDFIFHELHSNGVGVHVRHTPIISDEEEQKLWELGILGVDSPKSLQQMVFYYIGKRYCIRGGEEQRPPILFAPIILTVSLILSMDPRITVVEQKIFVMKTRKFHVPHYLKKGQDV